MIQENPASNAAKVRNLFADVLQASEKLKIKFGQSVIFNDSDVGRPHNRLDEQALSTIEGALSNDTGDRVPIPLTDKGNQKAPALEVIGVSGKGKEGERLLFRQEKDLSISVNQVGDRAKQAIAEPETETPIPAESAVVQPAQERPAAQTPDTTAINVFAETVEALPQSNTKALFQKLSADFRALGQQAKAIAQKNKEIASTVAEVPSAIKQDTTALLSQTQKQLADLKQSVQTKIAQTSIDDMASMAIRGTSAVAEAGSRGLGLANQYLQNRADKVKSYGMAKAALRIYSRGNQRTGESAFTANSYTVEAVTNGFEVKNAQNRTLMSFATDKQGKPISVTRHTDLQLQDFQLINQASRQAVIKGSPEAEAAYAQRLSKIAESLMTIVPENDALSGKNFYVSRDSEQTLLLTTQGSPRREVSIDLTSGEQTSTLTLEDLSKVEQSIPAMLAIQQRYVEQAIEFSTPSKSEEMEMV